MKLISIQVGLPRTVKWRGGSVTTGIFKEPITGPVTVRTLNLDGDAQADLSVHGGPDKAVYAYPVEHYEYWRGELPEMELPHGMFGENFTIEGLLETEVKIGDRFRVGEAELVVTQPRLPCFKLGVKFGRDDILKRFLVSRRSGFYLAVRREGRVRPGDEIQQLSRDDYGISVTDIVRLYAFEKDDLETLRRAVQVEALPESWRDHFRHQLEQYSK
ncbi:MAG TPA: MOSC domain-containing protein [Blastocatellia bacterium]|nr:MOSC domain-containing protein [Blastocatellia bacterium]